MAVRIYRIRPEKVTAIRQAIAADHWARNGYTLRAARGLGIGIDDYFLYVKADNGFFSKYEKEILIDGTEEAKGAEYDNVKRAIESEEDSVASGIALFG
jgi:hypothetical protein